MQSFVLTDAGQKKVNSLLGGQTLSYRLMLFIHQAGEASLSEIYARTRKIKRSKVNNTLRRLYRSGHIKEGVGGSKSLEELGGE